MPTDVRKRSALPTSFSLCWGFAPMGLSPKAMMLDLPEGRRPSDIRRQSRTCFELLFSELISFTNLSHWVLCDLGRAVRIALAPRLTHRASKAPKS
jgi:hypothetical protein